jgi:hypothetical protein
MDKYEVIKLRDRIGMATDEEVRTAMQRLTWLMQDASVLNTALDDAEEMLSE